MPTNFDFLTSDSQFATFAERFEAQNALMKRSLDKLELEYKSLMQKCFRGEIM